MIVDLVELAAEYRGDVSKGQRLSNFGRSVRNGAAGTAAVALGAGGLLAAKHYLEQRRKQAAAAELGDKDALSV